MKTKLAVSSVAMFLCLILGSHTQSQSDSTIYFYLQVIDTDNLLGAILDKVEENLNNHEFQLIVISNPDPENYPQRNLDVFPQLHYDEPKVSFNVVTPQFLELSSVLYAQLTPSLFSVGPDEHLQRRYSIEPEASHHISSALTALALYSVNQCDLAIPQFVDAMKQLEQYADRDNSNYEYSRSLEKGGLKTYLSFFWGNCELQRGHYFEAIEKFNDSQSVHSVDDLRPAPATNLAWTYIQLGEVEEAFKTPWRIIGSSSGRKDYEIDALYSRARLYLSLSSYDAALQDTNWALEIISWDVIDFEWFNNLAIAQIYILRGQIYLNLYEWDKALEDFNTAIELAPEYVDAYFQRGVLYYSILQTGQELREEALADFQHYLELTPDGEHADQAREYAAKIEAELAALNK